MSPAQDRTEVVRTDEQTERRCDRDQNQKYDQRERHLEGRQSGVQQGNVAHILAVAIGTSDDIVVVMRVPVVVMPMRMLVRDLRNANVPSLIRVDVCSA